MIEDERLWLDSYGFVYSGDGKRLLKGTDVEGAYWIPEGVEEIEPEALIGCKIGTLHVPWTAHVHEYDQLVFSEDPEENEELMPAVYFWTKDYANRDEETWAFEDEGEYRVDEHGIGYSHGIQSGRIPCAGWCGDYMFDGFCYVSAVCYTAYFSFCASDR